jgi:hypothetical protein
MKHVWYSIAYMTPHGEELTVESSSKEEILKVYLRIKEERGDEVLGTLKLLYHTTQEIDWGL